VKITLADTKKARAAVEAIKAKMRDNQRRYDDALFGCRPAEMRQLDAEQTALWCELSRAEAHYHECQRHAYDGPAGESKNPPFITG
jgi:hypothetical protein